ncbi:MAG: hypothetical protein Q4G70_11275 [Pseudomonadota bacterium]|nr:hypothetical protein [Pseudomonadota bacterium]
MSPGPRRLLAALIAAVSVLAACGGDNRLSWCIDGDGYAAGYNTTHCPPEPHEKPAGAAP